MEQLHHAIEALHELIERYDAHDGSVYDGTEQARRARIELQAYVEVLRGQPYDETKYCHVNDVYAYCQHRREAEALVRYGHPLHPEEEA